MPVAMRFAPVTRNLTKLLDIRSLRLLDTFSQYNPSPLSIQQFVDFGRNATEAESFNFLRKEIPIRLSNIMKEINLLPSTLLQMPSVMLLQEWYAQSFVELCQFESRPPDPVTMAEFCQTLINIQKRHSNVVETMARGVLELKDSHAFEPATNTHIQYFLDRFYMSRISLRMLINQHTLLFEPDAESSQKQIGIIDTQCNVSNVIKSAFDSASFLCEEYYNMAPDLGLQVHNFQAPNAPVEIVYPPSHLQHILFELFKNSMRAIIESKKSIDLPDIDVLVAQGKDDVTIKISDQGGGIPRHKTDRLFHYLFSTAPRPSMTPTKTPLAGYGYGLPLSRLYARYFHGDLILNSLDGYGTDAVVYLKSSTADANELLPIFNKTSTRQYKSAIPAADWTDPASVMNRSYHPEYNVKVISSSSS
jgi:pyruvate dehydrogenase kinase 2/3/4